MGVMGLVTASVGCVPGSMLGEDQASGDDALSVRRLLVCEQGLGDRTSGDDRGLFHLCEAAEKGGIELVRDGDYAAFGALDENGTYAALFDALDENGDGVVDNRDSPVLVHLVGFSWGGINITDVAERLRTDHRVSSSRKGIAAMVLLDPFQLQVSRTNIPSNVLRAWVYRETEFTAGDCSATFSLGFGFNGHRPRARSEMTFCSDYDLDAFIGDVGHCDVPGVATKAALTNLLTLGDYAPWEAHAVECSLD